MHRQTCFDSRRAVKHHSPLWYRNSDTLIRNFLVAEPASVWIIICNQTMSSTETHSIGLVVSNLWLKIVSLTRSWVTIKWSLLKRVWMNEWMHQFVQHPIRENLRSARSQINEFFANVSLDSDCNCRQTCKQSRYITTTKVNSAFHPSGVGKSSTGLSDRACSPVSGGSWHCAIPYGKQCSVDGFPIKSYNHLYLFYIYNYADVFLMHSWENSKTISIAFCLSNCLSPSIINIKHHNAYKMVKWK